MEREALAREVLISLFRLRPGRFVLIGGGALRLLHGSPRSSADLDLVSPKPPTGAAVRTLAGELEKDLSRLPSLAARRVSCRAEGHDVSVSLDGRPLVLLQFPAMPAVPAGERRLITGESLRSELIVIPSLDALLFCKAVAFLKRPSLKGRDAFDIWFLRERGAKLDEPAFDAWLRWEELDGGDLEKRLGQLSAKRLAADLSRYLPEDLGGRLEAAGYAPLRDAARALYAPWLEER